MAALVLLALLGGGRDPFTPSKTAEPPADLCTDELCRFKLDDLKLVAIVSGVDDPVAMFEDPHGKGIIARRNARIGRRGGRITEITRECVTVLEQGEKIERCMVSEQP
jgi:type IV pilus assembly protein PilP